MKLRNFSLTTIFSLLSLPLLLITLSDAKAAVEDLSEVGQTVVEQAGDNDTEGLQETVAGMSVDELAALAGEITENTAGDQRSVTLKALTRAAMQSQPAENLPDLAAALATAIGDASGASTDTLDVAMQGIIEGTRFHPDLEDTDEDGLQDMLNQVGFNGAEAFIASAEDNNEMDVEEAAGAVAQGGAAGLAEDLQIGQLRALVRGMRRGGTNAATDPNKQPVSRAMMRVLAEILPPELYRSAVSAPEEVQPPVDEEEEEPGDEEAPPDDEDDDETPPPQEGDSSEGGELLPPPVNSIEPEDVSGF